MEQENGAEEINSNSPLSIANERLFLVVLNDFLITMKHLEGGGSIYRSKFAPAKTGAVVDSEQSTLLRIIDILFLCL